MHVKRIWYLLRFNIASMFLKEKLFHEKIGEKLIIGCFLIVGRIFPMFLLRNAEICTPRLA